MRTAARELVALLAHRDSLDPVRPAGERTPEWWGRICDAASWHGVLPLLHHRLRAHEPEIALTAPAAWRRLGEAHLLATLRTTARRRQLHDVLGALGAAGVPAVVLKGACVAELAYASPELRPMSDLDLLVPRPALAPARRALERLGFAAGEEPPCPDHRHAAPLHRPGYLPVELHHTVEPCEDASALPLERLWARARPARLADADALVLAPEDLLLHLAVHMCRSHVLGASLVSIHDVLAWTERWAADADWTALVDHARAAGAAHFVLAALALARLTLGAAVPDSVLATLGEPSDPADATAVRDAAELLVTPPAVALGAKAVTAGRSSPLRAAGRVARALTISPVRLFLSRRASGRGAPRPLDGYGERWSALVRLLVDPDHRREAERQVAQVRALRAWAGSRRTSS